MVWKTRYSVRLPMHMIHPRRRSLWVWKLGSVKATAKPCTRMSRDGMIDHTGGGSWGLGAVSKTRFHPQVYRSSPSVPPPKSAKVQQEEGVDWPLQEPRQDLAAETAGSLRARFLQLCGG